MGAMAFGRRVGGGRGRCGGGGGGGGGSGSERLADGGSAGVGAGGCGGWFGMVAAARRRGSAGRGGGSRGCCACTCGGGCGGGRVFCVFVGRVGETVRIGADAVEAATARLRRVVAGVWTAATIIVVAGKIVVLGEIVVAAGHRCVMMSGCVRCNGGNVRHRCGQLRVREWLEVHDAVKWIGVEGCVRKKDMGHG